MFFRGTDLKIVLGILSTKALLLPLGYSRAFKTWLADFGLPVLNPSLSENGKDKGKNNVEIHLVLYEWPDLY